MDVVDFSGVIATIQGYLEQLIPVVLPLLGIIIGVPLAVRMLKRLAR